MDCSMVDLGKELLDKSIAIAALGAVVYLYEMRLRRKDSDEAARWNSISTLTNSVADVTRSLEKLADRRD